MEHEDLIQKLESLETPEIELSGHKQELRMALLRSGRFRERTVIGWARILAPITSAVVLIALFGFFNVVQPQLQIARAREIARNDPHVQALLGEYGLEIAQVKLQNGEALVLLAPESTSALLCESAGEGFRTFKWVVPSPTSEDRVHLPGGELLPGYILKVDLLEQNVSALGEIDEVMAIEDINLADIDFVRLEPGGFVGPEETDVD